MCLAAPLAVSLAACSTGMPSLPSIKNPFAKAEEKLPGQRVAVITDQSLEAVNPAVAAKPVALPPAVANAAWSDPGGAPSNSLGHLAMGERVNKSWRVDIGTGSSSSGRLSAVPIVADGKVFTLDAGGTVSAFSAAGGGRVWSTSVTPKNEKRAEGFGGGLALDSGRLYVTTGYGTAVGIDPGKGGVLWTQKIGEPVRSSPTAAGGKVYFVSTDSVLHCLDGNDGQELWIAVYYNVGFRLEPKGRTGFAHLFEHMMFQGSANVKKFEHAKFVEANGGSTNGHTDFDYTNYYQTMPSNRVELGTLA